MSNVQIRYTDVPFKDKKIRLVQFPDAPQGPSGFHGEFDTPAEIPNTNLPDTIKQEVTELFKSDNIPLYFDSTELVFINDEEVSDFRSEYVDDRDYQWQEATLKVQYE